ncbi:hypothetical protein [Streptomyces sp. 5-10]|uniref:hypothetical protein n=1 Tax=Streptomyces sp. 5-10 TaxID=878925 RepID=UPI00168AC320|nr:hypothetical protein [Streptomyces sp. 5-10]MBD3004526.1 hypothetical protein [Streptomyces sp. 5-10]
MKLHTHAVGRVSVVIMDQDKGILSHVAATPDELWSWMRLADSNSEGDDAFFLSESEWREVVQALDRHGAVHVETEYDCDLVVIRHLR